MAGKFDGLLGPGPLLALHFSEGVADAVGKAFDMAAAERGNPRPIITTANVMEMSAGAIQGYVTAITKHLGKGAAAALLRQIAGDNGLEPTARAK